MISLRKPNVCEHKHEQHHVSRDGNRHGSKQSTTHSSIFYPQDVWLFMAMEAGILFISLSIAEPYFSVRILQWNISNLDITHNRQKVEYIVMRHNIWLTFVTQNFGIKNSKQNLLSTTVLFASSEINKNFLEDNI